MKSPPPISSETPGRGRRWLVLTVRILLPLGVLSGGIWAAWVLLRNPPTAEAGEERPRQARLVQVETVKPGDHEIVIEAMGVVTPARNVELRPRVTGEVTWLHPELVPGGFLQQGEPVVRLDDADYRIEVRKQEAAVAMARGALELEQGQQAVAREELALIKQPLDEEERRWVLREPQMESAQASLRTAEAALDAARLNLERTEVKTPFNAIVLSRDVELGSQVTPAATLTNLAGTDRFWVEVTVPTDELHLIRFPDPDGHGGSLVHLRNQGAWPSGAHRLGRVARLEGELDAASRMARLVVTVEDPLCLTDTNADLPDLLLNSYLQASIRGRQVSGAYQIATRHLRPNDTVWIFTTKDTLEVRAVDVVHRGKKTSLVTSGLRPGERIVTGGIQVAVEGMALRTEGTDVQMRVEAPSAGQTAPTTTNNPT